MTYKNILTILITLVFILIGSIMLGRLTIDILPDNNVTNGDTLSVKTVHDSYICLIYDDINNTVSSYCAKNVNIKPPDKSHALELNEEFNYYSTYDDVITTCRLKLAGKIIKINCLRGKF